MWQDVVNKIRTGGRGSLAVGALVVLILIVIIWQAMTGKQRTLAASLENWIEAERYHVNARLDMDLPMRQNRQQPLVNVTFETDGDVQEVDNHPVFDGRLNIEARGRGMVLFADGDLQLMPDAVAFRLENLPTLLNPNGNLVEKWTYVEVPVLQTMNPDNVRSVFEGLFKRAEYIEKGSGDLQGLNRYRIPVSSEEDEGVLIEVFRQAHSGNRALHVIARLLRAYDVGTLDLWVDPGKRDLRRIAVTLGVDSDGVLDERATLNLAFSDYDKQVTIEEPPRELTVRPDVFGRIFGSGEIVEISQ